MLTNNLKKIISSRLSATNGIVLLTNTDGTTYQNSTVYSIPSNYSPSTTTNGDCYIAVGSGNTTPTPNDSALESEITGLDNIGNVINSGENGATWTATLTNTTNTTVTISEYGLYVMSGSKYKMLTRTVLRNPIILEVGEIANITINISQ